MSAKGTTWKAHKYIRIENGKYVYADSKSYSSPEDKKRASSMQRLLESFKKNKKIKLGGKSSKSSKSGGGSGGKKEKEKKEKKEKEPKDKKKEESKTTIRPVDDPIKYYKEHYSIFPKDNNNKLVVKTTADESQKDKKKKHVILKHYIWPSKYENDYLKGVFDHGKDMVQ